MMRLIMWQPIARNASGLVHNAGLLHGLMI